MDARDEIQELHITLLRECLVTLNNAEDTSLGNNLVYKVATKFYLSHVEVNYYKKLNGNESNLLVQPTSAQIH